MAFVDELLNKAKAANKTIVLCEGEDKRVVEAAAKIVKEGIAKIILLGTEDEAKKAAPGVDLSGVKIVDPATSADADRYAEILFKAREGKINKKTNQPEYADRLCVGRLPFNGQHFAPRLAGHKDRARNLYCFFKLYHGGSRRRKSIHQGRRFSLCRLRD